MTPRVARLLLSTAAAPLARTFTLVTFDVDGTLVKGSGQAAEASAHGFREDDRIGIGPGPTDEGSPAFVVREVRGPHAFVATRADDGGGGVRDREGAATRPEEDAFAFASEGEYAFQRRRRRVATVADESFFDGGMRGLGIDGPSSAHRRVARVRALELAGGRARRVRRPGIFNRG